MKSDAMLNLRVPRETKEKLRDERNALAQKHGIKMSLSQFVLGILTIHVARSEDDAEVRRRRRA